MGVLLQHFSTALGHFPAARKKTMAALSVMLTALAVLGPMINAERNVMRTECDTSSANDNTTIYDFSEKALIGDNVINLSDYLGKVVLVVNVATY